MNPCRSRLSPKAGPGQPHRVAPTKNQPYWSFRRCLDETARIFAVRGCPRDMGHLLERHTKVYAAPAKVNVVS
jgi:hypothetical protein